MWDLTNVEVKAQTAGLLPAGEYMVVAKAGEVKQNKAGTGSYLSVEFTIADGPFQGRKLWEIFNTANVNPQAVTIGRENMKKFFLAAGCKPDQLKGITPDSFAGQSAIAKVSIKTDSTYGDKNKIDYFKPIPDGPAPVKASKPKMSF